MKLALIGAAASALLAFAGPAAAQYPPPPPPPPDEDSYGSQPPPGDSDWARDQADQDASGMPGADPYPYGGRQPGDQDQPPPYAADQGPGYGDRDGGYGAPDQGDDQDDDADQGGGYGPPPAGYAPPPPPSGYGAGGTGYGPPPVQYGPPLAGGSGYGAGSDILVAREQRLERRVQRLVSAGHLDQHRADRIMDQLQQIEDEQDRLTQSNGELRAEDRARLSARLDELQSRLSMMRSS